MREINDAGLSLIEEFEGLRLRAYPDPGTGGSPWTIGYGHVKGVKPGDVITADQAVAFLREDIHGACADVERIVQDDLTDNQFAALVSFDFNVGAGNLKKLMKNGLEAVPQRIMLFGGKVLSGLTRRRRAERNLFLTP